MRIIETKILDMDDVMRLEAQGGAMSAEEFDRSIMDREDDGMRQAVFVLGFW